MSRTVLAGLLIAGGMAGATLAQTAGAPSITDLAKKAPPAAKGQSVIVTADWLRKPTYEELRAAYPTQAKAAKGEAIIRCIVTVQGLVRNCQVMKELPEGQGFGAAALALAPQFLFRPATRDGKPVESDVQIPVTIDCGGSCQSIGREGGGKKIVNGLLWTAAPTQLEMVAAYPAKAREKHILGVASIQCEIKSQGLKNCDTMSEEPRGQGFGNAAESLAKYFQQPANLGPGVNVDGSLVRLTFTFGEQMYDGAPYVAKPRFSAAPTADEMMDAYRAAAPDKDLVTGQATVRCKVITSGALEECSLQSEAPKARGVGQAVLNLAPKFKLATWTEDGLPVIGTFVRLPIKFDIKDPPKVEPAKAEDLP